MGPDELDAAAAAAAAGNTDNSGLGPFPSQLDLLPNPANLDFSQLLDLAESLAPLQPRDAPPNSTQASLDASHAALRSGLPDEALVGGFMTDWDLPDFSLESQTLIEEPDYGRFEDWIPHLVRPERPCDYCRSRGLNCYILPTEATCTPCKSLFRECSLTADRNVLRCRTASGYQVDTLDIVDEDSAREQGLAKGSRPLRSKSESSGGSSTPTRDDAPGSTKRHGIRFPRHAVKTLRDWLDNHADNPYPTEEEKTLLEKRTELKPSQIANWLANARRRRKVSETTRPPLSASPSLKPRTTAIPIPRSAAKPWDELDPFERWKNSPPENEPASITDIAQAVANSEFPDDGWSPSSSGQRKRSSNGSGWSNKQPASNSSLETGQTSSASASTAVSSRSHGSFGSFTSSLVGKKERRRRRRPAPLNAHKSDSDKKRIFQCTFCTDTFKSKYDWTRHEKSLHLSLEKWVCAPEGPIKTDASTGVKKCVYCNASDPSTDHIEAHNHRQCKDKGLDSRTFYRKDHLRQHLRLMHNCEMGPSMAAWRSVAVEIDSRCGFCAKRFTLWTDRENHLAAHFKAGAHMRDWKGCRGLSPAVAAQVMNAMPPYLIGIEAVSPIPFSASNRASWNRRPSDNGEPTAEGKGGDAAATNSTATAPTRASPSSWDEDGANDPSAKATTWEVLTVRLGKFANEMARKGVTLSDEMLQSQSRIIIYGSDDNWNQTAADNPEWLDLFKKAHGLDFIPSNIGGVGNAVPEDLETYGDLGLRIPFSVQLKAYNEKEAQDSARLAQQATQDAQGSSSAANTTSTALNVAKSAANGKTHLRRHKYSLPAALAQRFATTTGPWEESGRMPPAVRTAALDNGNGGSALASTTATTTTTTGAMMEFLGGELGADLGFSNDLSSSQFAVPSNNAAGAYGLSTSAGGATGATSGAFGGGGDVGSMGGNSAIVPGMNWNLSSNQIGPEEEARMMRELEDIFAETAPPANLEGGAGSSQRQGFGDGQAMDKSAFQSSHFAHGGDSGDAGLVNFSFDDISMPPQMDGLGQEMEMDFENVFDLGSGGNENL